MRKDDPDNVAPASAAPETDAIDSSWDDPAKSPAGEDPDLSAEIEILEAEESIEELLGEAAIHERVTAPPGPEVSIEGEDVLESGFQERQRPIEIADEPLQPMPILAPRRRMPSVQLDDPLSYMESDLDAETPSEHPIPIGDRVTPVQAPPEALLTLGFEPPPTPDDSPAARDMKERYAVGDFSGALEVAEQILSSEPGNADAKRYAQGCRDVLVQMYAARMGPLSQSISITLPADQIRWLSLDHRAGFLLSLVDGSSSVDEILDVCGMPRLDALKILYTLLEQRVISLSPRE